MSQNHSELMSSASVELDQPLRFAGSLAATRVASPEAKADAHQTAEGAHLAPPSSLDGKAVNETNDDILFVSAQVRRGFSEIERASAALRRAQPDLEAWSHQTAELAPARKPRPVWLVIGAVWISTVSLIAMATLAIAALVS
jgi:hypothetical protein